jgi:hypothetical protein
MILVRDIFRIKYGQTKRATELWKQDIAHLRSAGFTGNMRLLTDLAGAPYYTLVLESTHESLAAWEKAHTSASMSPEWRKVYEELISLTETGHREIFKIIE